MTPQTEPEPALEEHAPDAIDDEDLDAHMGAMIPIVQLALENITYAPATKRVGGTSSSDTDKNPELVNRTVVLKNLSTSIEPYKLTAWMGPSGSGKTSLISVAADLIPRGDHCLLADSKITVNGERGRIPKRLVGVVWQDDLLLSNLTVEENIYFAARLKTSSKISDAAVHKIVDETMQELGLLHIRHNLVGSSMGVVRGISGGERKRVSVASELVVSPSLLLLDEPTSGLDSTTAQELIVTLKALAEKGHSVVVVIHQPRTQIFNHFDHLLLLSKGSVLYDGPAQKARDYLEDCPSVGDLPAETGIADWMMDIITEDERREGGSLLADRWREIQSHKEDCDATMEKPKRASGRRTSSLKELHASPKYFVGYWLQLKLLTERTLKQQRGERLTFAATLLQCAYLFFTALFWWRLPDNTSYVFARNSLFFFMLIAQANGIVIAAVTVFQRERTLLRRERSKKMYGVSSFFLAKTASDMTNNVVLPLLYGMISYWTCGYRADVAAYFKFILSFYLTLSTAQSMGLFLGIAIPSPQLSLILAPPITLFFMIMGGFYIPFQNMSKFVEWISWLSFARYGYSALIINEYEGRIVPCDAHDTVVVSIGNASTCPFPGEDVIAGLGITGVAANFWFNIGIIAALQLVFRFGAYAWLRRTNK
jgi:ABC-type multidrug transport system ATPase subunit/ABC-type multidrug transport system permease subunit